MDNLIDFKTYKQAKLIEKDLEQVYKIMNLSIQGLSKFSKYKTAAEVLASLHQNKAIVETNIKNCKKIIEKKGKL